MIGDIFDQTQGYFQNPAEIKKFIHYYFTDSEINHKLILDAGCRVGDYSRAFLAMGARQVVGIDLSRACIRVAQKRFPANKKASFLQGDIANLQMIPDAFFDVIFCAGTINYLSPKAAKQTLKEFVRVAKPSGVILVLFQKDKPWPIKLARLMANLLPLKIYLLFIDNFAFLFKPAAEKIIGRKISLNYLKYDILLSLRGIHFGLPVKINDRFRVKTIKCEQCSEKTTASYKISLPARLGA